MGTSIITICIGPFQKMGVWSVLLLPYFTEIPRLNANRLEPDPTTRSAASDLGLHCLPMSLLWDATHIWVKLFGFEDLASSAMDSRKLQFLGASYHLIIYAQIKKKSHLK